MLQGRDEGLELAGEWWINGALSWSQSLGKVFGENTGVSRAWFCRAGPLPCSGRGAGGDALGLGEVPGCSALGQDHRVQQFQSFAQCWQEKCCVLGAKQGLCNKGSLNIPCKIPRRARKISIWLISLGHYKMQHLSSPSGCRPFWPFSPQHGSVVQCLPLHPL